MASTNSPSYVGFNIYTASEGELRTIPGVGKIIPRAILKLRGEVKVVTRELLRDIPMLRGNNDFCSDYILSKNYRTMLNSFVVGFYHLISTLNHSINFVCVGNNLKDNF